MSDGWQNDGYFWTTYNGCELIAWKGSHQIFVFPTWEYPNPPSEIINYHSRIETEKTFFDAVHNGQPMKAEYKPMGGKEHEGNAYCADPSSEEQQEEKAKQG